MRHVAVRTYREDPILSNLPRALQREGHRAKQGMVTGEVNEVSYDRASAEFSVRADELASLTNVLLAEKLTPMVEEFRAASHRMLFRAIDEVTEKYGMVIRGRGKPIPEQILEALAKVAIDFEDDGSPRVPTIFAHPDLCARMQTELSRAEQDPEFQRKFDAIIQTKYVEWRDREADRRLAD